jgi:hypothetical protein
MLPAIMTTTTIRASRRTFEDESSDPRTKEIVVTAEEYFSGN